jgi:hypothetical protein
MTDTYRAIYDAANLNMGGLANLAPHIQQEIYNVSNELTRPSAVYRPAIFADGNMWCALLGDDLQSGVCGFGETPAKAMAAFDTEFWKGKTPTAIRLEKEAAKVTNND